MRASPHHNQPPSGNRLLAALPPEDLDRLRPHLEAVPLILRKTVQPSDQRIEHVYFIEQGLSSTLAPAEDGAEVEVGMMGREAVIGVPVLLGDDRAPGRVIVQAEGHALRLAAPHLRRAMNESEAARTLLLRYAQAFLIQVSQTGVCNRLHTVEERLTRWLLMSHDRLETDVLPLTQEFLSYMLGVRRAGVNVAVGTLDKAGLIRHSRGRITVLDRPGLEAASCDCYGIVRAEFDRLLGGS